MSALCNLPVCSTPPHLTTVLLAPAPLLLAESLSWSPEPQAVPRMGIGAALPSTAPFSTAASTSGISCDDLKLLCWQRVLYRAGIEPHMLGML